MLHIMLCIMLHVMDRFATFPRPTRPTLIMNYGEGLQKGQGVQMGQGLQTCDLRLR